MFKVKVTATVQNLREFLFGLYLMNHRTFCYQIWYDDAASWARVTQTFFGCGYLQGHNHSIGWYDQNMTVSTILSELLIPWQPNLVWWYIIWSQSVLWKKWITAFRVKVTVKGQNLMFVQMVSSKPSNILFSNLALWFIIMSQSVMKKRLICYFKVKVTARAHMIKIWQFLLYLLNCWSFCYKTWFDCTLS